MELQKLNEEEFDSFIQSDEPVIVDFFATWCGSCTALMPVLEKVADENENVKIAKVDVDEHRDLAIKFGIKSIPALLVFQKGEVKNTSVGFIPKSKVLELLS